MLIESIVAIATVAVSLIIAGPPFLRGTGNANPPPPGGPRKSPERVPGPPKKKNN